MTSPRISLGVLLQIGVGDDQRILDDGAGARREQPVEAAVERDARDHRHQDGRHRGDHREQADDLHVQAGSRAAAPARLDHQPDLAGDDAEQQEHGCGVDQEQRDHHRNGSARSASDRPAPRRWQRPTASPAPRRAGRAHADRPVRRGRGEFGGRRLVNAGDAGHRAPKSTTAPAGAIARGLDRPTDAFIQQCCRIETIPGRGLPQGNRAAARPRGQAGRLSRWCGSPGYPGRGSSCAACCG